MITISNLTKKYGDKYALDNISFNVKKGEVLGFLGPNGAGKSTTMNIITGYISYTDGSVNIDGYDILENPIEVKKKIGYLPEIPPLYLDMVVWDYLEFVYELKKIKTEDEKSHMVFFKERVGGRSNDTVEMKIETFVSLDKNGKGVKIKTRFDNEVKDHRVRIMVPTGINSDVHKADSVFEVVTRNNRHNAGWNNPSACEHEQGFVSIDDGEKGIAVANIGLYEYEMLPDLDNTIAVTILRAVGEMGDWGVFPTPKAQCLGISETEIEIVPFKGDLISSGAYEECYQFRTDIITADTDGHDGVMPLDYSMINWQGNGLTLTGIKQKGNGEDIIIRWVNVSDKPTTLTIQKSDVIDNLYISNIIEKKIKEIDSNNNYFNIEVKPYEIMTVGIAK